MKMTQKIRYGVMYAQKGMEGRKVAVMDFKMERMILPSPSMKYLN